MLTVTLKPDIAEEIERLTQNTQTTVDAVVDTALRAYLLDFEREKLRLETLKFNEQKDSLLAQYEGKYIAMHNGQVIDFDSDLWALHSRVLDKLGATTVLLKQVTREPEQDIVIRSPRLELSGK